MTDQDIVEGTVELISHEIQQYCVTWARIGGQAKEKYGTVRFYVNFEPLSLHRLFYPGYHYIQYSRMPFGKVVKLIDLYVMRYINYLLFPLDGFWCKYVYRKAYAKAIKKYPYFRKRILSCADYPELLVNL